MSTPKPLPVVVPECAAVWWRESRRTVTVFLPDPGTLTRLLGPRWWQPTLPIGVGDRRG